MRCCCGLGSRRWIGNYDKLQRLALVLIYAQIGCSLLGSLSPLYNGVLILHLGISLFGLVAVESSNQSLARTYAFLLFCSFFLDLTWFFLFSHHIWYVYLLPLSLSHMHLSLICNMNMHLLQAFSCCCLRNLSCLRREAHSGRADCWSFCEVDIILVMDSDV